MFTILCHCSQIYPYRYGLNMIDAYKRLIDYPLDDFDQHYEESSDSDSAMEASEDEWEDAELEPEAVFIKAVCEFHLKGWF